MGDEQKLLFANDAFYAAFARADMSAMADIWAETTPVSVIHPGGDAVFGRDAVLSSWRAILDPADSFDIDMRAPHADPRTGIVVCYEKVGAHALVATNVFAIEAGNWRIVHHQSGPSPVLPERGARSSDPLH